MKQRYPITPKTYQKGHVKHIGMMAICCGLPLLLLFGISVYGITSQTLEYAILLICPVGMGLMMWMMIRSNRSSSNDSMTTETTAKTKMPEETSTNA